ncbi:MAG TPA: sulfurtransferase-like selenium metabolism protein YedF [Polyangia bacterium]|nr:sulfurtransferase-like selenium metabolism protein YedF [Polyangia bacterium]
MTEKIVDARGLACPAPVLETRKALADASVGELTVLVDNSGSAENVARMARNMGCEVRLEDEGDGRIRLSLSRTAAEAPRIGVHAGAAADTCGPGSNVVVLISSETLGHGDDDLGRLLMTAFVKTLKDVVPRPRTLIFMNGGVKHAVAGSDLLPAIENLEQRGVTVLACGTCLDFFHSKDKLAAGRVSNMFEILSALATADRVVRP